MVSLSVTLVPYETQGIGSDTQTARAAVYEQILNIVLRQPGDTAEHLSFDEIQCRLQRLTQKKKAKKGKQGTSTQIIQSPEQVKEFYEVLVIVSVHCLYGTCFFMEILLQEFSSQIMVAFKQYCGLENLLPKFAFEKLGDGAVRCSLVVVVSGVCSYNGLSVI